MFAGEAINTTENRAVLHAALRAEPQDANTEEEGKRIAVGKIATQAVKQASTKIRNGQWLKLR